MNCIGHRKMYITCNYVIEESLLVFRWCDYIHNVVSLRGNQCGAELR